MSMIRLDHVSKRYGKQEPALVDVSCTIEPGEFVSIIGQSGAGKSTFLRLLTAEEAPSTGKVFIGDWDVTQIASRHIPLLRRQMGMIFQDYKLLAKKTVRENIAFALEVVGVSRSVMKKTIPHVLKLVGLEEEADRFPHELSGGEQQRVGIARALVHRPKILLADEPTGNLDTKHAHDIIELLRKIHVLGTTVILVTHNRDVVNAIRERVIVLENGKIVQDHAHGRYHLTI